MSKKVGNYIMGIIRVVSNTYDFLRNREEAGEYLGYELQSYRGLKPVVLSISSGGLIVAREIARLIDADLDIIISQKITTENHRNFAKKRLKDRIVILADDGLSERVLLQTALKTLRQEEPEALILALPFGPEYIMQNLEKNADEIICLYTSPFFKKTESFYITSPKQSEETVTLNILREKQNKQDV